MDDEILFKTTLVFWKLYETHLNYSNKEMLKVLQESKYKDALYDGYYFENNKGERIPLKWIATTGKFFVPNCFKLHSTEFICKNNSPNVSGSIQIDCHLFPEGVLLLQAKLDFNDFNSIEELIIASIPTNIILSDGTDMGNKLDTFAEEIIDYLQTKIHRKKSKRGEKATPWHHNWIWWASKPETPISDFEPDGKHFKYALGMCTRSDKWKFLNTKNYSIFIEDIFNLSPYNGNCVYVSHPGNCIIPSKEFIDPNSIKNTLVDVIFAAEIGNVQRYLILNHLQDINFKSLEIQELLYKYQEADLSTKDLIVKLEDIEQEMNEIVLEVNKNLQITRTPRLIFTSVFKTKIMKQMVHVLHGDIFFESLVKIIFDTKDSIARQRDITSMKVDAEENTFLRNLQIIFVIGLIAQMITMFYMDFSAGFNWISGILFTIISVILSIFILYFLKRFK
ncbi:MAG: hypothetical protein ACTSPY_16555 [Candidatus Helarchaeota archaeon]